MRFVVPQTNRCFLFLCLWLLGVAVYAQDSKLEFDQMASRPIMGGSTHTYTLLVEKGQLVQLRLQQNSLDFSLRIDLSEGQQLAEVNLTETGLVETYWFEPAQTGTYRVSVSAIGLKTLQADYNLTASVLNLPAVQKQKQLAAQALLLATSPLIKQAPQVPPQAFENLAQALTLWRELQMKTETAQTLLSWGKRSSDQINLKKQCLTCLRQKRFFKTSITRTHKQLR